MFFISDITNFNEPYFNSLIFSALSAVVESIMAQTVETVETVETETVFEVFVGRTIYIHTNIQ